MSPVWRPGETAVQRFVRADGSIGQHHPLRVIEDDGERLLGWLPAGTDIVNTRLADGRDARDVPLDQMFVLPRIRVRGQWRETSNLRLITESEWSSLWWFFEPDGRFMCWYVNLEIPRGRTEHTTDRSDGALDVVVAPDRSWRWKDEDEAAAAVTAGRLTAADLTRLRAEGERVIALVEAGVFPFDGTWTDFRPDPDWPAPAMPAGLAVGVAD
ncbi:MAG TPA: DUF402 domain-containing protein [Pseudonocardiaceae bacterium]|jgi:hypothetical protein